MSQQTIDDLNHVRFTRATIKRELRAAPTKPAALALCAQHLGEPVREIAKLSVFDLIAAARRCGPTTALRMLNHCDISVDVKVGQVGEVKAGWLTDRQRAALIKTLSDPAGPGRRNLPRTRGVVQVVVKPVVAPARPAAVLTPEPETPGPSLAEWCPTCAEYAIALRDGTCGFCETLIAEPEAA